jgi:quinoprotein glucose dehydrogenase
LAYARGDRQKGADLFVEIDLGPVGGLSRTGPVLTKTLLFIAQSVGGGSLHRAYDKATVEVVHEIELPPPTQATPNG